MTIAALWGASHQQEAQAGTFFTGLQPQALGTVDADDGWGWLGASGAPTSRFDDQWLAVVSESDGGASAEDIAASYRRRGIGFAADLSGTFAFILFDRTNQRLVAASDAASRTPLAYWSDGDALALSSRALHLLTFPRALAVLDELYLAHLLTGHWAAGPGTTCLRGIRRLLPGVALVARRRVVELVPIDRLVARGPVTGNRKAWVDAFWGELQHTLDRAFASTSPTCLSLSGGLDSAAIASAIARHPSRSGPMTSLSIVAPRRPADESDAIATLEAAYAGVLQNRRVDCSDETDLGALDELALPDDPYMTPLALLPARLRLWRAASHAGFRTVLDGEGGDELFGVLFGPREAILQGQWQAAWHHLRSRTGARRAMFARGFVLPVLGRTMQRAWAARRALRHDRLPSFLSLGAASRPHIEQATQEFYEAQVELDFGGEIQRWLSNPAIVGAYSSHAQIASTFGLALASPLLERRVIELVLGIPAEWMLGASSKAFLPEAAEGRVPDSIRRQRKDVRLPVDLLRAILGSAGARRSLRDRRVRDRLEGWIRFERVEGILDAIGRGYDPNDDLFWSQITGLVSFAYWYSRASREYGVS